MTKFVKIGVAFAAMFAMTQPVFAEAPESDDPIIVVQNNWTSQLVLSTVVGKVLEDMGYTVEYAPSDSQLQFKAIADGDMHFQVEAWEGSMKGAFEKAVAEDGMIDLGSHDAVTREEWWVPDYVVEKCPGLPDWKALDKCAEIFAVAETKPKGRFVGPPADWGKNYAERVKALGMNFVAVNVGQAATLWAELDAAAAKKEPIVLFNWTPNFVEAKHKGMFIDFPDPEGDKCAKDPSWGINPDMVNDCGAPRKGWLKKAAWKGLEGKYPAAWKVLSAINFSNEQIAAASLLVDVDGMSTEEAADKWIADNQEVINKWKSM
ncbi:MAG: ABC transporter substrate-binding protein [Hyphomicrobiales bacterium]